MTKNKEVVDAIMNINFRKGTGLSIIRKIKIIITQVLEIRFMNVYREQTSVRRTLLQRLASVLVEEFFTMTSAQILCIIYF